MTTLALAVVILLLWILLMFFAPRLWARRDERRIIPDPVVPLWFRRMALIIALVAPPVTAGFMIWPLAACFGGGFDVGVTRREGECVGVSDGRYKFSGGFPEGNVGYETRKRLDRVEDLIERQNDIPGGFVKIAYLAPLTSPLSGPRAVDELEGVAAAQKWINKEGRGSPKIQLLIAHMGSSEKQWKPVVDQLTAMKNDREPLVAVVGLGLSQDESRLAAEELEAAGIPMVASSLTATELDRQHNIRGLHQVSFTNDQQINALFQYLVNSKVDLHNVVVVQSDDESDSYAQSSAEAIKKLLSSHLGFTPVSRLFGDPHGDQGKLGNQFRLISQSLCRDPKSVVFYAGRSRFLSNFIQKLDAEPCVVSARVVSASDAAVLRMRSGDPVAQQNWGIDAVNDVLKKGKVSLLYTPVADRDLLKDRLGDLTSEFRDEHFDEHDLLTRWAITGWDSLLVTAEWVQRAQSAVSPRELPQAVDVTHTSTQRFTDSDDPFHGASGDFWFDDKGHRAGDLPKVVRLLGDGSVRECPVQPGQASSQGC